MNIYSNDDKLHYEIQYEIQEPPNSFLSENKNEIDNLINDESFFSDFKEEYEPFDVDNLMAQQVDYFENYNVKLLSHIVNYYNISKRKLKKEELITTIIQYENNPENSLIVSNRKRLWYYLNELKNDPYFGKFVFFN